MTPLVLVHGFLGGGAQWRALSVTLGPERAVIALDLPGFGAHAHLPPLSRIEDYAAWVVTTLQDRGVDRYHLLGHSMGGMIAQEIARLQPGALDRLILYGTGPEGTLPGRFETIAESKRRAQADGADATAQRIAATWLLERETSPQFPAVREIAQHAGLPAILAGLTAMEHWSGTARLDRIEAETLIIWGDRDRSYDWPQINTLCTGIAATALCVMPNCAHLAHLEEPEVFHRTVQSFIANR